MSSHQGSYYYSDPRPIHYESGPQPSVAQQHHYPRQSLPATAPTGIQSGYSQAHQSVDAVGSELEIYDEGDTTYSNHPHPNSSLSSTSFQDPGIGANATYINDNTLFPFADLAPLPFFDIDYGHPQNQSDYAPYEPAHRYPNQPIVHDAHQTAHDLAGPFCVHPALNIHTLQSSQPASAPVHPYPSSTQLPLLGRGGPVYRTGTRSARPTLDNLVQDVVDTGRTELPNVGTTQYSHLSNVATFPDPTSAPGPSRPLPSSPERKRLLPLSTGDDHSTARRVVPRHNRAWSVHSSSSESYRRSRSNSVVHGRGLSIPQERYTTSSISSYSAPPQYSLIAFNLENPDQTGIPVIDVLNKTNSFSRIRDSAQAFNHMEKKTFTLRVQWPGYKPWSKTIATMDWKKSRNPITRVKLAEVIAIAVRDLIDKYRNEPYDRDYAEWNVGPNGIQLDQICLVAVHHVSRGSWQPEFCLLEPPR